MGTMILHGPHRLGAPAAGISEVGAGSQRASAIMSGDSGTIAFPANVVSGNMLVVLGVAFQGGAAPTSISVTDTRGTSYTVILGSVFVSVARTFIAYGLAPSSGANTVTVNPEGSTGDFTVSIDEFTGVTQVDVDGLDSTGTSSTPTDSITTSAADTLILGVMTHASSTVSLTAGSGYTQIGEVEDNSSTQTHHAEFKIVSSAGANSVTWTTGSSVSWIAQTYSLKA